MVAVSRGASRHPAEATFVAARQKSASTHSEWLELGKEWKQSPHTLISGEER